MKKNLIKIKFLENFGDFFKMSYEKKILDMRKIQNSYLITILREAVLWNPLLDEVIVLCDILRIFDKLGTGVSKNEVRTAFKKYYDPKFHGDKKSYLTWIYSQFHVKSGIVVRAVKIRDVPSKNSPPVQTTAPISAPYTHDLEINNVRGLVQK